MVNTKNNKPLNVWFSQYHLVCPLSCKGYIWLPSWYTGCMLLLNSSHFAIRAYIDWNHKTYLYHIHLVSTTYISVYGTILWLLHDWLISVSCFFCGSDTCITLLKFFYSLQFVIDLGSSIYTLILLSTESHVVSTDFL